MKTPIKRKVNFSTPSTSQPAKYKMVSPTNVDGFVQIINQPYT